MASVRATLESWLLVDSLLRWLDSMGGAALRSMLAPLIVLGLHIIEANLVQPWLLSRRIVVSPIAIFLSAASRKLSIPSARAWRWIVTASALSRISRRIF